MANREVHLSNWQGEIWTNTARYKVCNLGRRSGKTTLAIIKSIDFAQNNNKSTVWIVSPTYKQTKAIAFSMLAELIPQGLLAKKPNETELVFTLKNGSQIFLKGADNPDSLRGVRIDFCVLDEVAFFKNYNEVWKVIRPTLVDSKAEVWFISTPNGLNHFYELRERAEREDDWAYFHHTSYENPYISSEELDKMKVEMTEDAFAQEILGEFRKMTGLIYKEFDRDIHMVEIPSYIDSNWTFTRSLDFGFAHKTALVYFAISPTGKEIYAYDGIYLEGMTVPDIADVVRIKDSEKVITSPVADSAQPAMIEELNRIGIRFSGVDKGPDSVKNGISKVAEMLKIRNDTGKPTIMFNKNLNWIAQEFESYRWVENKSADNAIKEVPYKVGDDAMDAIRYMAMTYKGGEAIINPNLNWNQVVSEEW